MSFFEPGTTYFFKPHNYAAPEQWQYFQCKAVTVRPGTEIRIAFGFIKSGLPDSAWTPTGLGYSEWARDWTTCQDN
ncbi:hypothetical protein [Streptomyces sp. CAU 1734]|uniref:hypothetical protein n=1 Tax=Streptomyces sp. CAU 1734 TaxID=3140360 RepID=UPI00325FE7C0